MQFSKLRLSGFKSFVDATEFHIEPGLTGVVGPNGCGKSNLLEALRWVMGANSAKAMRGEGMDDVIFAGSSGRPGRNHAEVMLTVDQPGPTVPARFLGAPVLEVVRRIDRGAGSTYRINGVEVRARDVQLLFADASTGANSPALVRQGQISELIAARPQNRRRILEEAAGISGLHGRRHEAHLRVQAAEANLARLDDVARELESGLGRLRREARTAARYKMLAGQIRGLQSALLHARWAEGVAALDAARVEAKAARAEVESATRRAALAQTAALNAQAALPALRDEDTASAAILHHASLERDRLQRGLEAARADLQRQVSDLRRIREDAEREARSAVDATGVLARLAGEIKQLEAEVAASPARIPDLEAAADRLEADRTRREAELEAAAADVAAGQADARAARVRLEDARRRAERLAMALSQAEAERQRLAPAPLRAISAAEAVLAAAISAHDQAHADLEAAELKRSELVLEEAAARRGAREAEDQLNSRKSEARGLERFLATAVKADFAAALEGVEAPEALAAAVAAALGEELSAGIDATAPSFWRGRDIDAPVWPEGVTPLSTRMVAPPELAARIKFIGLVDPADGERLQKDLPAGARLVSVTGDLWRWDGFTATSEAPRPAQVRLEQRSRLAKLRAEILVAEPREAEAKAALAKVSGRLAEAEGILKSSRARPRATEFEAARAREALERLRQESLRVEAKRAALDDTVARLQAEHTEARAQVGAAETAVAAIVADAANLARLETAREAARLARTAASTARAAVDREIAVRSGRSRRLDALRRDQADWTRRAGAAARRIADLDADREKVEVLLAAARDAPDVMAESLVRLEDSLAVAQTRRSAAATAIVAAEAARTEADRAASAADAQAATARETRAGAEARHEAASARVAEQVQAIWDASGLTPEALGRALAADAVALPTGSAGAETHLAALERELAALGAVNLLAEDEAAALSARLATMSMERADLSGALGRLRRAIEALNEEGRERLTAAFEIIDRHFRELFTTLFEGGAAELRLVESDDPLEAGLEILACPPGKRMAVMSLMSGGEQALTAVALIFAVFLANPAPICVLDEVDAPLDDANVERFCDLLAEMRRRAATRFLTITHNPLTMSRMDRLFGVTMRERGVSQLVSVDLREAEALAAQ